MELKKLHSSINIYLFIQLCYAMIRARLENITWSVCFCCSSSTLAHIICFLITKCIDSRIGVSHCLYIQSEINYD